LSSETHPFEIIFRFDVQQIMETFMMDQQLSPINGAQ